MLIPGCNGHIGGYFAFVGSKGCDWEYDSILKYVEAPSGASAVDGGGHRALLVVVNTVDANVFFASSVIRPYWDTERVLGLDQCNATHGGFGTMRFRDASLSML